MMMYCSLPHIMYVYTRSLTLMFAKFSNEKFHFYAMCNHHHPHQLHCNFPTEYWVQTYKGVK